MSRLFEPLHIGVPAVSPEGRISVSDLGLYSDANEHLLLDSHA